MMRLLRQIHLFLGCFFAPLLLFFILTGWRQTVSGNRTKALGEGDDWWSKLSSVHVDQVYPSASANSYSPGLFKALVILMCIGLILTTGLGIFLAFRVSRKRWVVWLALVLGILIPVLLLRLGQNR